MEDDAIQPDVSTEAPKEEAKPVLSEREQAMLAIQQEITERYAEPKEEEKPVVEEAPAPVATPQTVRVKVDGEEKELPLADVVKGYQKDSVASKRLEEAAQKQRELEQKAQELAERERQIALASLPAPPDAQDDDADEIAAAINALVEGDNEAAVKFLKDAVKKGRQPATPVPKAEEIAAQVKAELDAKMQAAEQARVFKEFAEANPLFKEPAEGELYTPQRVRGDYLFNAVYGPQVEAGKLSYREALDKTAEHVAKEFAPPTPVNERQEAKKKIDNIPVATGARPAQQVKERTTEDALAEMRKWRGQPT